MCLKILRRLFWGAYFHNYVFEFMKKKNSFPGQSNRDTLTHIVHVTMSSSRNFLLRYAPDCTFQDEKLKSSLPSEGGDTPLTPLPHPPPARSLRSFGLGRFAPSQRLRPPKMFWLITPLEVILTWIM